MINKEQTHTLVRRALRLGATDAGAISPADIAVDNKLADLCNADPGCEHYGLAPGCPPHVSGPAGFRQWIKKSAAAIVVRIDVPTAALFSDQRREIMQLLHETVAGVESKAVEIGFVGSQAFAGGSCKQIFCHDQPDCPVLSGQGKCRHPQSARPSMSGFGIDVARLMQSAGWSVEKAAPENAADAQSMSWVAGLVLAVP